MRLMTLTKYYVPYRKVQVNLVHGLGHHNNLFPIVCRQNYQTKPKQYPE